MNCSREMSRPEEETGALRRGERGFTLAETAVAFLIMMIVLLGVASVFAYAVYNNSSAADRTQTLALAQQSMETLRGYRFAVGQIDDRLKQGSYTQTAKYGGSGREYKIDWQIEDTTGTVKTIMLKVTPVAATRGPATSVTIVTQRAISD